MILVSWNTNGLRAAMKKGFNEFFEKINADIFAIQETKMQDHQLEIEIEGYFSYMNSALKKGYSGTLVFTKKEPLSVSYGLGIEEHDQEGRIITLEFEDFYFINIYTPNSKDGLLRLPYRMIWEDLFRDYVNNLKKKKSVIICGDLNVAHKEIDLKNPDTNHFSAGFSDEERQKFSELLDSGFIDTFRHFYPDVIDRYSWWSYRTAARDRNAGWRIDYFLVSLDLKDKLKDANILDNVMGSDHCPVSLEIDL